jgi:plasmid segregation protein ParM
MGVCIWCLDDGYGDNKLFNGKATYLIPSHATHWRPKMKSDIKEANADPLSYIGVEIDGMKYLVGQGALEQDTSLYWSGGENKHVDQIFPILLKTCLAVLAEGITNPVVDPLVMGLPVKADEKEDRHELLQRLVVGKHEVTISFVDGANFTKEVCVKELVTKKQPFLSFCDVILDKRGQLKEEDIAGQFNVIIDIGSRTLNIYTLDALEPITDLSDTTSQGIYTAYDMVGDFIEEQFNFRVPNGKITDVIRRGTIKGMDLSPVIDRAYSTLANEIARVVHTMFVDSWAYVDKIYITGGGSELLKMYLESAFPVSPDFLDRFATARGGWKYGVRHALQKSGSVTIKIPGGGVQKVIR